MTGEPVDAGDVVVDPETGEILEPDIPFELEDEQPDDPAAEPSTDLAVPSSQLVGLFGQSGPRETFQAIEMYATELREFLDQHDLALEMEDGSLYVTAPGVEAGGQLTGWFAEVDWTEQIPNGWKARAHAQQPDTGRRGGSREAVALRTEPGKKWKSESDLQSLAQTRACRKALNATIGIIWNAAGYDADPEEKPANPKQRALLFVLFEQLGQLDGPGKEWWKDWATRGSLSRFGKRISGLSRGEMTWLIERMKRELEERSRVDEDEPYDGDGYEPTEEEIAEAEAIEFG